MPPKVIRKQTPLYGLGVFAAEDLPAGTFIAQFDGPYAEAASASELPISADGFDGRHAIQVGERLWRDGPEDGIARLLSHSCEPNCGIVGVDKLYTMRHVHARDELTWDYAMTEWSDARIECLCGSPHCRGVIGSYGYLTPEQWTEFAFKHRGFISQWIVQKDERLRKLMADMFGFRDLAAGSKP